MFSVYKGLLLFVLFANAFALPIKRSKSDGKVVVFEKMKTLLSCTCYYEENESLDSSNIDEYCDCVPEKIESDKSLIDKDNIKIIDGKYIQESQDDSNLTDVQRYGSADADFFANLEENEAKEEQEAEEEAKLDFDTDKEPNEEEITAAMEGDIIEDIPEYNIAEDEINLVNDKKYIVSTIDNNDDSGVIKDSEDILDADGNPIHIEVEMVNDEKESTGFFENTRYIYSNENLNNADEDLGAVGEPYAEVNDDDDDDDDNDEEVEHGFFENTRYIYNNNFEDDDDDNEELIGVAYAEEVNDDNDDDLLSSLIKNSSSKFLINDNINDVDPDEELIGVAYSEEANDDDDDDDEIDPDNVPSRPTISRAMKSIDGNDHRRILEEFDEPILGAETKYVINYYNENNEQNDDKQKQDDIDDINDDDIEDINDDDDLENIDDINEDDDLKSIYKKLVIKKLKSDIKKMDSEKLIVDILKDVILKKSDSSEINDSLKNILN